MSVITTRAFWEAAAERAAKTAAQSAILVIGAEQLNAISANWADVGGFALGGAVLSLLTSVASLGAGGVGPSLTSSEQLQPPSGPTGGAS